MSADYNPRIECAERSGDGVIITFDDGKTRFYSAALLYEVLPNAKEIPSEPEEWDQSG